MAAWASSSSPPSSSEENASCKKNEAVNHWFHQREAEILAEAIEDISAALECVGRSSVIGFAA